MSAVHLVVPEGIDDPARPSGGNRFDRRVRDGLRSHGWELHVHEVSGSGSLARLVSDLADDALVLLDGLVASPAPDVLVPEASRLRLVVLVHMPLGDERERAVLRAATSVITTSEWTRRALLQRYPLPPDRVHVAEPGVDTAELAPGTADAGSLLSVAAVIPGKGHDVLVEALSMLRRPAWTCVCVGSLERDPGFAATIRRRLVQTGLDERVQLSGAQPEAELDRSYGAADVLVLPTRAETYGMVVTEALARGLPVVAADVGGVSEALGHGADGERPGVLVPPDDPAALSSALRAWLEDDALRRRLRRAARERRESLPAWSETTAAVAGVLTEAAR
ncbi:MAG TPA: glycosyltransferase family 4 protein [Gaiellaceae bacterium]|nr:glycosyltransferase family 4 protein [Gaiellaceae bacterium]